MFLQHTIALINSAFLWILMLCLTCFLWCAVICVCTASASILSHLPFLSAHIPDVCCYLLPVYLSGPAFLPIRCFGWMWVCACGQFSLLLPACPSLTCVATSLCRQRGMSSYTMSEWVQRDFQQQGFALTPNAEFRVVSVPPSTLPETSSLRLHRPTKTSSLRLHRPTKTLRKNNAENKAAHQ
jgi:hypothetical protein